MSSLDSVAVFRSRLVQLGLNDIFESLDGLGWNTLGSFAFASNPGPNGGPAEEESFQNAVLEPLFGPERSPRAANLRRLHFEAYTAVVGDLHRKTLQVDDSEKPKSLAAPEREVRLKEVKAAIGEAMVIEADLEPSDMVVDKFSSMQEHTGVLKYVPLTEIGRRDMEIRNEKKNIWWKSDSSGVLRQYESSPEVPMDVSTDYKLHRTFLRRGVAMHMAHLLSFHEHDKLVRWMMKELHRDPPPRHAQTSIEQILEVDKEVFIRMAEETRGGLNSDPGGMAFPLDSILSRVILEPRIVTFLIPLPLATRSMQTEGNQGKKSHDAENERLKKENEALRSRMRTGGSSSKGKGEGKSSGRDPKRQKVAGNGPRMPKDLLGLNPKVDGINACYAFNLNSGCNNTVDGNGACNKGRHACMKCGSTGHGSTSSRCSKH